MLCVVITEDPAQKKDMQLGGSDNGSIEMVKGVNVEVSLTTGTLCAERNAISTAFRKFPKLERKDLKAIAVLSLNPTLPNLGPCRACQE